jgi:hypothetical protein
VEGWTRDRLDPESALEDVFSSCEQGCIRVLVSPPATFCLSSKPDPTQLQPYHDTAERLKNAVEVVKIVRAVKAYSTVDDAATAMPPFILLQGSSGMGMTQMAFNLMAREDVGVFCIPCAESTLVFDDRHEAFMGCVKQDMLDVSEASAVDIREQALLYSYGFVWALLSGASSFTGPRRRDEVLDALKAWRRRMGDKNCVFFLDDVQGLNLSNARHAELQFRIIVNLFRSVGLVAIVSATQLPARELREIAKHSGDSDELWAIVFPSFPRFCHPSLTSVRSDLRKVLRHSPCSRRWRWSSGTPVRAWHGPGSVRGRDGECFGCGRARSHEVQEVHPLQLEPDAALVRLKLRWRVLHAHLRPLRTCVRVRRVQAVDHSERQTRHRHRQLVGVCSRRPRKSRCFISA